jgi:S1-C subfamily serine protease
MVIASVFGVGLFAGWTFSSNAGASLAALLPGFGSNNIEAAREAAIAKVGPAVVQVNVTSMFGMRERVNHASVIIVDKQGHIVTNNRVVQRGEVIEVVFADGNKIENVQVTGTDPMDDLAVLQINPPANMAVATLGDSSKLQVGQDVLAVGNPLGFKETVTHGIISALGRAEVDRSGSGDDDNAPMIPNTIQTDAPINQGSGGGALVDLQGNVIGISTLIAVDSNLHPANGVGFAIPANQVKLVMPQIIQDGSVTHTGRAALGITSNEVDTWDNLPVDHGVYIADLTDNGPAAKAGLEEGDVIVAINGKEVSDESSLGDLLAAQSPGDKALVSIYRGDQPMTLKVTLGELPANG